MEWPNNNSFNTWNFGFEVFCITMLECEGEFVWSVALNHLYTQIGQTFHQCASVPTQQQWQHINSHLFYLCRNVWYGCMKVYISYAIETSHRSLYFLHGCEDEKNCMFICLESALFAKWMHFRVHCFAYIDKCYYIFSILRIHPDA